MTTLNDEQKWAVIYNANIPCLLGLLNKRFDETGFVEVLKALNLQPDTNLVSVALKDVLAKSTYDKFLKAGEENRLSSEMNPSVRETAEGYYRGSAYSMVLGILYLTGKELNESELEKLLIALKIDVKKDAVDYVIQHKADILKVLDGVGNEPKPQNGPIKSEFALGVENFKKNDLNAALANFTKAIVDDPKNIKAILYVADCYNLLNNYAKLRETAQKISQIQPNNPWAPYYFGLCASILDKKDKEAVKYYTDAIVLNQNISVFYTNRAWSYYYLGLYSAAVTDASKGIELSPSAASGYRIRALANVSQGLFTRATFDLKLILSTRPNDESAKKYLDATLAFEQGAELFAKGEKKNAIDCFNKTLAVFPKNQETNHYLARCYYGLREFDRSAEYARKTLQINPNLSNANNIIGLCQMWGYKNYQEAIRYFDIAIQQDPQTSVYLENRADVYFEIGKYDEALASVDSALKINPKSTHAPLLRAKIYIKQGQKIKAISDLKDVLKVDPKNAEAMSLLSEQIGVKLTDEDVKAGLTKFTLLETPKETFSDVAGMAKMKEELRRAIIYPFQNPELAKEYGITAGGGVLLYGPPGCGKTFIVKATAGEAKANLIDAKISEVMGVWIGTTEKNIHNLFELARHNAPAILFIDELDALGGSRDTSTATTYANRVNSFLSELDGLTSSNENVLIIGATNSPWLIDPALKRSGRFGKLVYVPPPDLESRKELFINYLKKKPLDSDIDYDKLAQSTSMYSCADITSICSESAKIPWEEALKGGQKRNISMIDITSVINSTKPTLPAWYESARVVATMMRDLYPDLAKDIEEYDQHKGEYKADRSGYR